MAYLEEISFVKKQCPVSHRAEAHQIFMGLSWKAGDVLTTHIMEVEI